MKVFASLRWLGSDQSGSMVVETAIIIPALAMMSIGGFEASRMIARESELQTAATAAGDIAVTAPPNTPTKQATLKSIIMTTTGLSATNVLVIPVFRCGTATSLVEQATDCTDSTTISSFVKITLTDTYTPSWTNFGISSAVNYNITRTIQLS